MSRETSLGEFEQIILLAILRLGDSVYGVPIRAEIAHHTGREIAPGALYTTLERLELKGFVKSRLGESTPERGGRPKRYYEVTGRGVRAVSRAQRAFQSLLRGLELTRGSYA
jgi:DNA-binding PadR family transcriptional regulator